MKIKPPSVSQLEKDVRENHLAQFSVFNPLILSNSLTLFVTNIPSWNFTIEAINKSFGPTSSPFFSVSFLISAYTYVIRSKKGTISKGSRNLSAFSVFSFLFLLLQ